MQEMNLPLSEDEINVTPQQPIGFPVLTRAIYNAEGKVTKCAYQICQPGQIIDRAGHMYEMMPNGSQRRRKDLEENVVPKRFGA